MLNETNENPKTQNSYQIHHSNKQQLSINPSTSARDSSSIISTSPNSPNSTFSSEQQIANSNSQRNSDNFQTTMNESNSSASVQMMKDEVVKAEVIQSPNQSKQSNSSMKADNESTSIQQSSMVKSEPNLNSISSSVALSDTLIAGSSTYFNEVQFSGRRPRRSTVSKFQEEKSKVAAKEAELAEKRLAQRSDPNLRRAKEEKFASFNCAKCEGTGEVVVCDGLCCRVWHHHCVPNELPQNLETDEWMCKECANSKHECFGCKQSGHDDVDVFQCSALACGRFYHRDCIKDLPLAKIDKEVKTNAKSGQSETRMTSFKCPQHSCHNCHQLRLDAEAELQHQSSIRSRIKSESNSNSNSQQLSNSTSADATAASCECNDEEVNSSLVSSTAAATSSSTTSNSNSNSSRKRPLRSIRSVTGKNCVIIRCIRCEVALHSKGCLMVDVSKRFQGNWMICDTTKPGHSLYDTTDKDAEDCELDREIPPITVYFADPEEAAAKGLIEPNPFPRSQEVDGLFEFDVVWLPPKRCDFKLPGFMIRTAENERGEKAAPIPYKKISTNYYNEDFVTRPTSNLDNKVEQCECASKNDLCEENCYNRAVYTECSVKCANGDDCRNQRLRRREWAKTRVINYHEKGWGLRLEQNVSEGDLIIEYCGEVISEEECAARLDRNHIVGIHDFYMFKINSQYVLDATPMASAARFINHSCSPNCRTQLWTVGAYQRVGIFAIQAIEAGTELTYDYCCTGYWPDGKAQKCHCGSKNCRGFLGAKAVKLEKVELSEAKKKKIKRQKAKARREAKKLQMAQKSATAELNGDETESASNSGSTSNRQSTAQSEVDADATETESENEPATEVAKSQPLVAQQSSSSTANSAVDAMQDELTD